jgi:hypothetical protein
MPASLLRSLARLLAGAAVSHIAEEQKEQHCRQSCLEPDFCSTARRGKNAFYLLFMMPHGQLGAYRTR